MRQWSCKRHWFDMIYITNLMILESNLTIMSIFLKEKRILFFFQKLALLHIVNSHKRYNYTHTQRNIWWDYYRGRIINIRVELFNKHVHVDRVDHALNEWLQLVIFSRALISLTWTLSDCFLMSCFSQKLCITNTNHQLHCVWRIQITKKRKDNCAWHGTNLCQ